MRCVFARFLEEIEDSKMAFPNYLTFKYKALLEIACSFIFGKNLVYWSKTELLRLGRILRKNWVKQNWWFGGLMSLTRYIL